MKKLILALALFPALTYADIIMKKVVDDPNEIEMLLSKENHYFIYPRCIINLSERDNVRAKVSTGNDIVRLVIHSSINSSTVIVVAVFQDDSFERAYCKPKN